MRKPTLIFWISVVAIFCCGAIFLSAVYFFIQNQCNIYRVYQTDDLSSTTASQATQSPAPNTPSTAGQSVIPSATPSEEPTSSPILAEDEMTIQKDEYIKRLSEAQNTASSRDLIALMYGVLSTVFITVGLHFLRETGQSCKRAEEASAKLEGSLQNIQKTSDILTRIMSVQFHILPAANLCRSIELFFAGGQFGQQTWKTVYRYFPRIFDDLRLAEEVCIGIDAYNTDANNLLSDLSICVDNTIVSLDNIDKMEKAYLVANPNAWVPLTATWNNYIGYCTRINEILNSIKK